MKVKVLKDCFPDGSRRSMGSTFDYKPRKDADGKDIIPKYLEPVVPPFTKPEKAEPEKATAVKK